MMLLNADMVGIGETIGNLGPTALLGLMIAFLYYERYKLQEEVKTVRAENALLQASAVVKAEAVTQKVADALHASERAFDRTADAMNEVKTVMERVLNKM